MAEEPIRVLLVASSVTSTNDADYTCSRAAVPPLGLHQLAHYVRQRFAQHAEVQVLDPVLEGAGRFDLVAAQQFDVVGFSPTHIAFPGDLPLMGAIHQLARAKSAHLPIFIAGGSEATMNAHALCQAMSWLDACVGGPGEGALGTLLHDLVSGRSRAEAIRNLRECPGVMYCEDRDLISTAVSLQKTLSPYAGQGIPYERYWNKNRAFFPEVAGPYVTLRMCRILTTAYCSHSCRFCSHHVEGRATFGRPVPMLTMPDVAEVLRELTQLYNPDGVFFNDSDVFQNPMRARELLRTILSLKARREIRPELRFYGQTRIDSVDAAVLRLAQRAGFVYLSFGIESFCDKALAAEDLAKGYTAAQACRSVELALGVGIPLTNVNLILLHPTATRESISRTICRSLNLIKHSFLTSGRLTFWIEETIKTYAGAPIHSLAAQHGWPVRSVVVRRHGDHGELRVPSEVLPADPAVRRIAEQRVLRGTYPLLQRDGGRSAWNPGENALAVFLRLWDELDLEELQSEWHRSEIVELQMLLGAWEDTHGKAQSVYRAGSHGVPPAKS